MQTCPNCDQELDQNYHFCPSCGQQAIDGRLKVKHVVHEFSHAVLHTDKSMIYLMWKLLRQPGYIARDYVMGKRKSYFSPFNFLVVAGAMSIFILSIVPVQFLGHQTTKHYNLIIFLTVPILAWFTYLFYRSKGYNYAECAVLATYTGGMRSLFFTFVIVPVMYFFPRYSGAIVFAYMFIYFIYFAFANAQFSGKPSLAGFLKGFVAALLMQVVVSGIIMSAGYLFR